jgi:hypothetical protein
MSFRLRPRRLTVTSATRGSTHMAGCRRGRARARASALVAERVAEPCSARGPEEVCAPVPSAARTATASRPRVGRAYAPGLVSDRVRCTERAIRCGLELIRALAAIRVPIRVGIHSGEVELSAEQVSGVAVHAAARIVARRPQARCSCRVPRVTLPRALPDWHSSRGAGTTSGAWGASTTCSPQPRASARRRQGALP